MGGERGRERRDIAGVVCVGGEKDASRGAVMGTLLLLITVLKIDTFISNTSSHIIRKINYKEYFNN